MGNNIQIFQNSEFGSIRVMEDNGEAWFVGKEVAQILGYLNTRDAVRKHVDKEDKASAAIHDGRQHRHYIIINETGLYSLIHESRRLSAKRFKRWIDSDVLGTIRKHIIYSTKDLVDNPNLLIAAENIKDEVVKTRHQEDRQKNKQYENKARGRPVSALFGTAIGNCSNAVLIRDYVKILAGANIKISQDKLFKWLHSKGYIYRDKGTDQWLTYKKYIDMGIFLVSQSRIKIPNFGEKQSFTLKITVIGQKFFYEELRREFLIN